MDKQTKKIVLIVVAVVVVIFALYFAIGFLTYKSVSDKLGPSNVNCSFSIDLTKHSSANAIMVSGHGWAGDCGDIELVWENFELKVDGIVMNDVLPEGEITDDWIFFGEYLINDGEHEFIVTYMPLNKVVFEGVL